MEVKQKNREADLARRNDEVAGYRIPIYNVRCVNCGNVSAMILSRYAQLPFENSHKEIVFIRPAERERFNFPLNRDSFDSLMEF